MQWKADICIDNRFSRIKETIWFLLIQLKLYCFLTETHDAAMLLRSAAKALDCTCSPAELFGIWQRAPRMERQREWALYHKCEPPWYL